MYRKELVYRASKEFISLVNAYEVEKTVFFSDDQWKALLMVMYVPDEFIAKYLIKIVQ